MANCETCSHKIRWDARYKEYDCRLLESSAGLGKSVEHNCRHYLVKEVP